VIPGADYRMGVVRDIGLAIEGRGWKRTAQESGVDRCALHRAFGRHGRGHPTMTTINRVLPGLGLRLAVVAEVGQ
jgi:DNA-binding phage protein